MAGRIREYQAENRAASDIPSPRASPNDFGAQIGAAMGQAGDSIQSAAATYKTAQDRNDGIDADLRTAKIHQAFTKQYFDLQNVSAPGAKDFATTVGSSYDAVSDQFMGDASEATKRAAAVKLANLKTQFVDQAIGFEATSAAAKTRNDAKETLDTNANIVTLNPAAYDVSLTANMDLIDKLGLPADVRDEMKRSNTQQLTHDYFSGRLDHAQSGADVDAVLADMADPKFTGRMDPKNTEALVNNAQAVRTTIATRTKAAATAAIKSLRDRMEAGESVPANEINAADSAVKLAQDPSQTNEWMILRTRNEALTTARTQSKAAVDAEALQIKGAPSGFTPELDKGIGEAVSATGGKVSAQYIAATLARESGGLIAREAKKADGTRDYDFGAAASSARGPVQFIESTFINAMPQAVDTLGLKLPPAAAAELEKLRAHPGANPKSFPALLKLRADPNIALKVFATFTLQNRKELQASLGRNVNDAELYMAHFLGSGGAATFLKAFAVQPGASAVDVVGPAAAAANRSVFYDKDGTPKSVSQVYYGISSGFNGGVNAFQHERGKALTQVSTEMTALNQAHGDPMTYAAKNAGAVPADLTQSGGFAARGAQAMQQAEYYKLDFPKPLTNDEAGSYKHRVEDGSSAEAVAALRELGQFKGRAAEGASKQIAEQSPITAHLAGLFAHGGVSQSVAEDTVRGMRRITDDKGSKEWLGGSENGGSQRKFDAYVGAALDGIDPRFRGAAKTAADAYYVQKFAPRDGTFDDAGYQRAVDATLAGRIGEVNGAQTVLPSGVTSAQMERAVDNISQSDLTAYSVHGGLPYDAIGRQILPHQISVEGTFEHRGGDVYALKMADDRYAITGDVDSGGAPLPYLMTLNKDAVLDMASRGGDTGRLQFPRGRPTP